MRLEAAVSRAKRLVKAPTDSGDDGSIGMAGSDADSDSSGRVGKSSSDDGDAYDDDFGHGAEIDDDDSVDDDGDSSRTAFEVPLALQVSFVLNSAIDGTRPPPLHTKMWELFKALNCQLTHQSTAEILHTS
jgi:hypothetical protein